MRRDYTYLTQRAPVPNAAGTLSYADSAWYADPVWTSEERHAAESRLAEQRARIRRAKAAERYVVLGAAAVLAIAVLPVTVIVGAVLLARALWRRYVQGTRRPGGPVAKGRAPASVDPADPGRRAEPAVTAAPVRSDPPADKARAA